MQEERKPRKALRINVIEIQIEEFLSEDSIKETVQIWLSTAQDRSNWRGCPMVVEQTLCSTSTKSPL